MSSRRQRIPIIDLHVRWGWVPAARRLRHCRGHEGRIVKEGCSMRDLTTECREVIGSSRRRMRWRTGWGDGCESDGRSRESVQDKSKIRGEEYDVRTSISTTGPLLLFPLLPLLHCRVAVRRFWVELHLALPQCCARVRRILACWVRQRAAGSRRPACTNRRCNDGRHHGEKRRTRKKLAGSPRKCAVTTYSWISFFSS